MIQNTYREKRTPSNLDDLIALAHSLDAEGVKELLAKAVELVLAPARMETE